MNSDLGLFLPDLIDDGPGITHLHVYFVVNSTIYLKKHSRTRVSFVDGPPEFQYSCIIRGRPS
jgi:hypothetical protein